MFGAAAWKLEGNTLICNFFLILGCVNMSIYAHVCVFECQFLLLD